MTVIPMTGIAKTVITPMADCHTHDRHGRDCHNSNGTPPVVTLVTVSRAGDHVRKTDK